MHSDYVECPKVTVYQSLRNIVGERSELFSGVEIEMIAKNDFLTIVNDTNGVLIQICELVVFSDLSHVSRNPNFLIVNLQSYNCPKVRVIRRRSQVLSLAAQAEEIAQFV